MLHNMTNTELSEEIAMLRNDVERKYGKRIATSTDFARLSKEIAEEKVGYVSQSTLKRIWGYVNDTYSAHRTSTLDNLARYIGFSNFDGYVKTLRDGKANVSGFNSETSLDVSTLSAGAEVELSWHPNRVIVMKYLGDLTFMIISSKKSKLKVGMRVKCLTLVKGQPMLMNVVSENESIACVYIAGKINGISWRILS